MQVVTIDGKKYQVTRTVIKGSSSNMSVNKTDYESKVFEYEVAKTQIIEFDSAHDRNNEIYMILQNSTPASLGDDCTIHIYKANNVGRYVETIWEGTLGQLPSASERTNINNIVTPNAKVRIDEGFKIKMDILDDEAIVVANCTLELRVIQFLRV